MGFGCFGISGLHAVGPQRELTAKHQAGDCARSKSPNIVDRKS
jgi:hypothetical protein